MSKAIQPRTNGDRVQPFVDRGKKLLAETVQWAKDHPDEVAVSIAPLLMLATATKRHRLGWAEAVLVAEVGYWSGVAMCAQYRQWKARPAGPSLREVI